MTCIRTSSPIERAFRTRPQWQTAGRREHVHGRIQYDLVTMGKRINSTRIALGIGVFVVVVFGLQFGRAFL